MNAITEKFSRSIQREWAVDAEIIDITCWGVKAQASDDGLVTRVPEPVPTGSAG